MKNGFTGFIYLIAIWLLGWVMHPNKYNLNWISFLSIPLLFLISWVILINLHELAHAAAGIMVKIKVKEIHMILITIKKDDGRWGIHFNNPLNTKHTGFIGAVLIQCDAISNEIDFLKFTKKMNVVSLSGPVFSYIMTLILLIAQIHYGNFALKVLLVVSIIVSFLGSMGDVSKNYQFSKNISYASFLFLATDILSGSYFVSEAREYLEKQMKQDIEKLWQSDLPVSHFNYELSNFMMLLFLSLATDKSKIDEDEFYAVLGKLKNPDVLTTNATPSSKLTFTTQLYIYSILYLELILNKGEEAKSLLAYAERNNIVRKSSSIDQLLLDKFIGKKAINEKRFRDLQSKSVGSYQELYRSIWNKQTV
ncbi:hypothetical protein J7E73_10480 [Paenibacillus albidus]|uniref:site-2 protease family protein n=1 Tax=Paenibacillus albidus TaxID=2041023 RepID=UPI001BEC0D4D|nr:site-2 protease family protein [Paenibacillus albidus]MBT2289552.1 hypothetical protein [Paenibacillus albidus]